LAAETQETAAPESSILEPTPEAETELPAWLIEPVEETPVAETPLGAAELDSWIQDETGLQPDRMAELASELAAETQQPEPGAPEMNDMDAALAWLEGLAAKQGADEESLKISKPEERAETPPTWLADLTAQEQATSHEMDLSVEDTQPVKIVSPVIESETLQPAWIEEAALESETPVELPAVVAPEAELPDWLAGLEEEQPVESTSFVEPIPTSQLQAAETEAVEETIGAQTPVSEQAVETTAFEGNDVDAAMAWLEALAAKQGADAESLKITTPEERSETPPAWIAELAEQDKPAEPAQVGEPLIPALSEEPEASFALPISEVSIEEKPYEGEATIPIPQVEETLTEELEPIEPPVIEAPAVVSSEAEIPDWLLNYEEEQNRKTQAWQAPVEVAQPPPGAGDESITVWLQRHHPEPGVPISQPATAEETPEPAWIPTEEPLTQPNLPVEAGEGLVQARASLSRGDIDDAVEQYTHLVQSGEAVDETIQDLREALYRHPVDVGIWQTLGEAYIRADRVQEALDAYTKAEELLR
jgi:uncharacterized protein Smg (DUF494 family)